MWWLSRQYVGKQLKCIIKNEHRTKSLPWYYKAWKLSLILACLYCIKHFFNIHLMKARLLLIASQVFLWYYNRKYSDVANQGKISPYEPPPAPLLQKSLCCQQSSSGFTYICQDHPIKFLHFSFSLQNYLKHDFHFCQSCCQWKIRKMLAEMGDN